MFLGSSAHPPLPPPSIWQQRATIERALKTIPFEKEKKKTLQSNDGALRGNGGKVGQEAAWQRLFWCRTELGSQTVGKKTCESWQTPSDALWSETFIRLGNSERSKNVCVCVNGAFPVKNPKIKKNIGLTAVLTLNHRSQLNK